MASQDAPSQATLSRNDLCSTQVLHHLRQIANRYLGCFRDLRVCPWLILIGKVDNRPQRVLSSL